MERSRFDPLTWPTRLVLGALGATLVLNVVAVVSDVSYHDLIHRLLSGGDVSLADAQAADDRQFTIAGVQLAVFALTALAFVVWFYRAYENLRPLGAENLRWGSGWAIGAWFVPLLNLVRPKSLANDVWRGSDPALPRQFEQPSGPVPWWHHLWWALFLANGIFARVASQTFDDASALADRADAANLLIASDALGIAASAAAIAVVLQTTRRQRLRAAALRAA
jgi:Domain of unknown function (DUF4328)